MSLQKIFRLSTLVFGHFHYLCATMRMIILYILFVAFGCQQTTFLETENLKTSKSENSLANDKSLKAKGNVQKFSDSQVFSFSDSKNSFQVFNFSDSQFLYYESQILLADSLYKNYLPQYNFDEVKAAVAFFERTTVKSQQTTDFVHKNKPQQLSNSASQNLSVSTSQNLSVSASQQLSNSASCARAHYYHAVGLTERNDIVGACEHYLRALEIMEIELETENLKTSKSERRLKSKDKRLKKNLRNLKSQNLQVSGTRRLGDSETQPLSNSVTQQLSDSATQPLGDSVTRRLGDSNYETLRFLALTYTRLGRLFYNENYCDLAITKYRKALKYVDIIEDELAKANVLKELGNSYQLANKLDSALYYYNESLRYNSSLPNKLDVEKSIAQILIDKGERDSAYMLLKNNLYKINNDNIKYSYHFIIGDLFYRAEEYDSALYYLEESLDNCIISKRIAYVTKLSAIYDSLGDYEKRSYYDNISSRLFKDNVNKEVDNKQLQVLYDNYRERINERERSIAKAKTRKQRIAIVLSAFVAVTSLLVFVRHKHKRHSEKLSKKINEKEKYIRDNEFRYSFIEGKIKRKNIELQKKEEEIRIYQQEIAELKSSVDDRKDNFKEYCQSEICAKILNDINELSKSGKDTSKLQALGHEDFVMLLQSANLHLGNFLNNISTKYPTLKKEDFYYLCLTIINLNDKQIASLFGVTYNAIRSRRKKICLLLDINIQENICKKIFCRV